MMENNYNLENKRIFVDGCIDEACCIPLCPRDFSILPSLDKGTHAFHKRKIRASSVLVLDLRKASLRPRPY